MGIFNTRKIKEHLESVHDFSKAHLPDHREIIQYKGEITEEIINEYMAMIESELFKMDEQKMILKRVYYEIVENLQNIYRHADEIEIEGKKHIKNGIFILSKNDNTFGITTGNIILKSKSSSLKKTLDNLNNLSFEEIKELYRKQLSEGTFSEKGGAGLGFIDSIKKTGNKLIYDFIEIDNDFSLFVLITKINRKKK